MKRRPGWIAAEPRYFGSPTSLPYTNSHPVSVCSMADLEPIWAAGKRTVAQSIDGMAASPITNTAKA
jgi:hypothetical protein